MRDDMISTPLALKLCGLLYIYILVTNAASVGLGNRNDITDSATMFSNISEDPGRFRTSVNVAIMSHLGILAITGMLYLAFSSHNRQLALIGSACRLGEGIVMIYNEVSILGLLDLAKEYALFDSNKESLKTLGDQILQRKGAGVDLGLLLLAVGALAYCISFMQSGAVPSTFAWLGAAAGVISALGILIKFASGFGTISVIGMVMMMVFEVTFGGWLITRAPLLLLT